MHITLLTLLSGEIYSVGRKYPLNSKPIPQIGSTNYPALFRRSCSLKIRYQTVSVVMGERSPFFPISAPGLISKSICYSSFPWLLLVFHQIKPEADHWLPLFSVVSEIIELRMKPKDVPVPFSRRITSEMNRMKFVGSVNAAHVCCVNIQGFRNYALMRNRIIQL